VLQWFADNWCPNRKMDPNHPVGPLSCARVAPAVSHNEKAPAGESREPGLVYLGAAKPHGSKIGCTSIIAHNRRRRAVPAPKRRGAAHSRLGRHLSPLARTCSSLIKATDLSSSFLAKMRWNHSTSAPAAPRNSGQAHRRLVTTYDSESFLSGEWRRFDERIHHVTEGAPTSDVNTNGDDGSWSRLSRRSARSSTPLNG
jgi:hypothetical protein